MGTAGDYAQNKTQGADTPESPSSSNSQEKRRSREPPAPPRDTPDPQTRRDAQGEPQGATERGGGRTSLDGTLGPGAAQAGTPEGVCGSERQRGLHPWRPMWSPSPRQEPGIPPERPECGSKLDPRTGRVDWSARGRALTTPEPGCAGQQTNSARGLGDRHARTGLQARHLRDPPGGRFWVNPRKGRGEQRAGLPQGRRGSKGTSPTLPGAPAASPGGVPWERACTQTPRSAAEPASPRREPGEGDTRGRSASTLLVDRRGPADQTDGRGPGPGTEPPARAAALGAHSGLIPGTPSPREWPPRENQAGRPTPIAPPAPSVLHPLGPARTE